MNNKIEIINYNVKLQDEFPYLLDLYIEANTCKVKAYYQAGYFQNIGNVYISREDNSWINLIVSEINFSLIERLFFNLPTFQELQQEARSEEALLAQGNTSQQEEKKNSNSWIINPLKTKQAFFKEKIQKIEESMCYYQL